MLQLFHRSNPQIVLVNYATYFVPKPVFGVPNVVFLHHVQIVGSLLLHSRKSLLVDQLGHRREVVKWNDFLLFLVFDCEIAHPLGRVVHELVPGGEVQAQQVVRCLHRRQRDRKDEPAVQLELSLVLFDDYVFEPCVILL